MSEEKALDFYSVEAAYIHYLSGVDPRTPRIDYSATSPHDKFLCGIVLTVSGHDYFAPISSFKIPQRTNLIIKDHSGKPLSSIRFSFMIPVPPAVLTVKRIVNEPSPKYRNLLNQELQFCLKNEATIRSRAHFVYTAVTVKKDPLMVQNCCDFKALEIVGAKYQATS